jgi:LysR family transcriptional regulator, glycine cleavage system transcriptional activator
MSDAACCRRPARSPVSRRRRGTRAFLTQSAISRQIAVLEDMLQLSLFHRNGRRVELNAEGRTYLAAIEPALERIQTATAAALVRSATRELNIATLPSFGMRWLAPRLPRLTARHPDIVVNFAARTAPFRFADEAFDAAIHFGLPDWCDATHDLLFREQALPVCAPDRLARQPIEKPEDVLSWPLLVQSSRRDAWAQWLRLAKVDHAAPAPAGSFEHFLMLAQASAAGAGIALIPRFLIETELAEGTLTCPLDIPFESEKAYYLVSPASLPPSDELQQFRAWLIGEASAG